MSGQSHTPGDWATAPDPCHFDSDTSIVADGGHRVAEVTGRTIEEALANARLIAAAPDLLTALKDCRRAIDMTGSGVADWIKMHDRAVKAASAAIAKASVL